MRKKLNDSNKILLKIARRMKLSTILLLIGIIHVYASSYAQEQKVSVHVTNGTFYDVVTQIESQSEFLFFYESAEIDMNQRIMYSASDKLVPEILDEMLKGYGLSYQIMDRQIMISKSNPSPAAVRQQGRRITGTVLDDLGEPIIGANIIEKGTTNGVISDLDGKFTLTVQENATLQISFIGFNTQEIPVRNQSDITVTLREDLQTLDEVVVVGYGVQRRVNLTGSVSSVNFDEEMQNRPITDASQALSGKISGIWVSQNSGRPGADGAELRVRGWGTLNDPNPLVIIDGVQGNFNTINPNDIESISVLKDAASAAIYGSKAANGVILITTKTGNRNERTEVTFSTYAGLQTIGRRYNLVTNSAEFMRISNIAYANDNKGILYPEELINRFETGGDKYKYPNTEWFNLIYEPSWMYDANLSIRGGTQRSSSFLSFNYQNQDGMVPNTSSYRFGIRANLDYDINKWLKVGGRMNFIRRIANEPFDLNLVFTHLQAATPFTAPYDRHGRFGSSEAIDSQGIQIYDNLNPLISAYNGNNQTTNTTLMADAYFQIDFTNDLFLKTTWSSNGGWTMQDRYNIPLYGYTDSGIEDMARNYNREGLMMIRNFNNISWTNNVYSTLNYNKKFAGMHDISVIAGLQMEDFTRKNVYAQRTEPAKQGLTQVDAGTSGIQAEGTLVGYRMFSYFGRINYGLLDKYLFEVNFRADASSRFKADKRWGYFPGFSVGWRLSEENFMKDLGVFSNLKLRASWGQLGNQNVSGYWPYLEEINQNFTLSYSYGGSLQSGAAVTAMVDPNITWETSTTTNVGIDIGLMNNRLTIEADFFNKITKDILVQLPIPLLLGGKTAAFENVGEMLNRGVEFTVNYDKKTSANSNQLGYNLNLNFTYIHNEVTKFREDAPDQLRLIREGYSYRTLYGYKAIGIYQSDEDAKAHMHSNSFTPLAGNLKFEDVNNDGRLDYQDKQEMGNTIPKITFGLTTRFNYKNFDLNLLFQGLALSHLYNQNTFTGMIYQQQSITAKQRDAWTPENSNSKIPAVRFDNSWDRTENSYWVNRQDFIKLRNIQLGYLMPQTLSSKIGMNRLYVYANAQNVFTLMMFKGYEGYDPERSTTSSGGASYPAARVFSFGINLTF